MMANLLLPFSGRDLKHFRWDVVGFCWTEARFSCDRQWMFYCVGRKYREEWSYTLSIKHREYMAAPLNVSGVCIKVTVRSIVDGRSFVNEETFNICYFGHGIATKEELRLDWDRTALLKTSTVEMVVEMEILKVFGYNEREIEKADWERNGVR